MDNWTDFSFSLSSDAVLRGEGMDPGTAQAKRPALVKAAEEALWVGLPLLQPVAILQETSVCEHLHERILLAPLAGARNGTALTGPLAAKFLAGAERVAMAVCTIGPKLEERVSSLIKEDPLLALALDGVGNAAVEALGQQVCGRIAERAQAAGLETSAPLSPGEPEWPVDIGQPQIFSLLDTGRAGVRLTGGGMMIPKKTISFVVGIGQHMQQADLCGLCSMRERCRYRNA